MASTALHCSRCRKRRDIYAAIEGKAVRCHECGLVMSTEYDGWFLSRAEKDRYTKKILNGCRIRELLWTGPHSQTYRATDSKKKMPVSFEIFPHDCKDYCEEQIKRIFGGVVAASGVRHLNIVRIYDVGRRPGYDFIISELIDSPSLRTLLENKGPIQLRKTLSIAEQILAALAEAGRKNVIHGRLSPDNILLDYDGSVKLQHFGRPITQRELFEFTSTESGGLTGPCYYLAPEQAEDVDNTDSSTDLYTLGLIVREMLAGRKVFHGNTAREIIERRLEEQPPPLDTVCDGVPEPLCRYIDTLHRTDPDRRFDDPEKALKHLQQAALSPSERSAAVKHEISSAGDGQKAFMPKAAGWTFVALLLVALSVYPLWRMAFSPLTEQDAASLPLEAHEAGRTMLYVNLSEKVLPALYPGENPGRKIAAMLKLELSACETISLISPFLLARSGQDRIVFDEGLLVVNPALIIRIEDMGPPDDPTVKLSLTRVRGGRRHSERRVESVTDDEGLVRLFSELYGMMAELDDDPETTVESGVPASGLQRSPEALRRHLKNLQRLSAAVEKEWAGRIEDAVEHIESGAESESAAGAVLAAYYRFIAAGISAGPAPGAGTAEPAAFAETDLPGGQYRHLHSIIQMIRNDSPPEAVQTALAAYVSAFSDSPRAHTLHGIWRMHTGVPPEEALAAFRRALTVDPEYMPAARAGASLAGKLGTERLDAFLAWYETAAWSGTSVRTVNGYAADIH